MKKIRMFILNSGQEVIAEEVVAVDPDVPNSFIVKQALVVRVVPQGQDSYGLALNPLSPTNPEGEIRIFNHSIVGELLSIPDGMERVYIQQTSSIEIATSLPGNM